MADTALSPDEMRSILRECVTVVRPGEILVVRVSENFTPAQLFEYQLMLTSWFLAYAPGIQVRVVVGEGGQIVRQEPEPGDG